MLWTFERTVGVSVAEVAMMTVVLAFPAALGAATARLVI
ncbi:MAG: TIGR02587 family membrane protein [Pseudomonadota bacterium]|nr:TIGR02587 family membrane protein [Pseudomonadota bacterium]